MAKRGVFFALEGGEGSGKSTQLKLLEDRWAVLFPGRELRRTREPGGAPIAETIRSVILNNAGAGIDAKSMFGFMTGARMDHVRVSIAPALAQGVDVGSDRYFGSTFAYQVVAMENPVSHWAFRAHVADLRTARAFPSLTIVLDLPVETGLARAIAQRGTDINHLDTRDVAFHTRVRRGFYEFAQKYPKSTVIVDAEQSIERVQERIVAHLRRIIK